jgi:hypothetical protein
MAYTDIPAWFLARRSVVINTRSNIWKTACADLLMSRSHVAAQRLGYLVEGADQRSADALADFRPASVADLRPGQQSGLFSTR